MNIKNKIIFLIIIILSGFIILNSQKKEIKIKKNISKNHLKKKMNNITVLGAVNKPGTYKFDKKIKIKNAIKLAKGLTSNAFFDTNLNEIMIIKNDTIIIPVRNPKKKKLLTNIEIGNLSKFYPKKIKKKKNKKNNKINLNTASAAELKTISGIGDKRANDIIKYRQQHSFNKIEELLNIRGIGKKTLENIRNRVTLK